MKPSEAIRQIMEIEGIRPVDIGKALGLSHQAIHARLASPRMSAECFADTLSACGYKLVAMPAGYDIPVDAFPID